MTRLGYLMLTNLIITVGCSDDSNVGPDGTGQGACPVEGITRTDESGAVLSSDSSDWCIPEISELRSFGPAYPNPSTEGIRIPFNLSSAGHVSIRIADGSCANVRDLVNEERAAGHQEVVWDGKDDAGVDLPAGLYRCSLVAGDFVCHGDIELQ